MKRFVWRLQRVLDVKTKQEQVKRIELFRVTEELAARRSELLMRQRILQDTIKGVGRNQSPTRLKAQEFVLRQAAANDEQIRRLKNEIVELEMRRKQKTSELLSIRRLKEGLDRLRTEARDRFMHEQDKLEQKEQDDRTIVTFTREVGAKEQDQQWMVGTAHPVS